jgi:hypothetical protein
VKYTIKTNKGILSRENKEDWIPYYNMYLKGELKSLPDIACYLGISYKGILGIFSKFSFKKITASETSRRCNDKVKAVRKEKYGDENYNNRKKAKSTLLEKYGDENYHNTEKMMETRERIHGSRSYINLEKMKETKKKRYNDENYSNKEKMVKTRYSNNNGEYLSEESKNCVKRNKKEKYDDENYNNRKKAKETCILRYGEDNPAKCFKVKDRIRNSVISKTLNSWGDYLKTHNYTLLDEYKGTHNSRYLEDTQGNSTWMKYKFRHDTCGNIFEASFNNDNIRCLRCFPLRYGKSQDKVFDFISNLKIPVLSNDRTVISPCEIDIYLPDLKIGFEYNGTLWHSSLYKEDSNYHKMKTELALSKDIKLYHIWEHDDEEIIKSMISGIINKNIINYHARKLQIKEVKTQERQLFFDKNHLHGDVNHLLH